MGTEKSKEVQKWADPAMFAAEPLKASDGPKVYLLSMTSDPLGVIAAACKMYKGEIVRNLSSVTDAERSEYFQQVQKTKLQAPFEFVDFHFMIEGVTRSFTHQMVRQRTAVYAQESLRFAVKEDMAESVALPPSLAGTKSVEEMGIDFDSSGWFDRLSEDEKKRYRWEVISQQLGRTYLDLIDMGMPAEDARGLLPHNITTRLHYKTNLRSLLDHAGNRLCTQAQFEWRAVFAKIIEAIRGHNPWAEIGQPFGDTYDANEHYESSRWQFELLSTVFKPICYQAGKCEFKANFDRACKIRDRVDAFHGHGVEPDDWGKGHKFPAHREPFDQSTSDIPWFERNPDTRQVRDIIPPISPVEWIADPGAAR